MATLSYQTAVKLKEAGFPQDYTNAPIGEPVSDYVYSPTLEELIEACGDELYDLQMKSPNYWIATGNQDGEWKEGFGSTPSEAVANLWLALNT
jgi:hypothetical protein